MKTERRGFTIHWIDALLPIEDKVNEIKRLMQYGNNGK
jgi:tRNA dimethylallyltransferase